jgi:hypothetical protein
MSATVLRRVVGILLVILIAGAVVTGVVLYSVVSAARSIGEGLSSDTTATFRPKVTAENVQFEMTYGKNVVNLSVFTVLDAGGNKIWEIEQHGTFKPTVIVYGELPAGPERWTQTVPAGGGKPPDIRGKSVRVEVNVRYSVEFGLGHQTYRGEFDIPAAP